jgi:copper homeostasis protein (lipoprotein)
MRVMRLSLLLILAACQSWTAFEQTSATALDWVGVYQGVVPCADCEGIETTLRLAPDGTYELSLKYLGKSTPPFSSKGSFKWRQDGREIELQTSSGAPRFYRVEENRLRQLDTRGQPIESALADKYVLRKLATATATRSPP